MGWDARRSFTEEGLTTGPAARTGESAQGRMRDLNLLKQRVDRTTTHNYRCHVTLLRSWKLPPILYHS